MAVEKPRPSERILRFLVRLFPFEFRFDHGREIERTFRDQERDASREGRVSVWRLWAEFVAGIFQTAPREHLSILRQDATYAVRRMRQSPGFTLVVLLTLALGIGANTAIFSVVDHILLRPLPFANPHELVIVGFRHAPRGTDSVQVAFADFRDLRDHAGVFQDAAAVLTGAWTLVGEGADPARVAGLLVTPNFFSVTGRPPAVGRAFAPEETEESRVVVMSHRLWKSRFGGDPAIVGSAISLDNGPHTVIGVLPPDFDLELPISNGFSIKDNDLWLPLTGVNRLARSRAIFTFEMIARLKPGTSSEHVDAALNTMSARLAAAYPDTNTGRSFWAKPLHEQVVGGYRAAMLVVLGAVGFVLLIACANVANLLLARLGTRRREIAIRTAIGAGRGRIVGQLLLESVVLALAGGTLGFALAAGSIEIVRSLLPENTPRLATLAVDARVLFFCLGVSLLAGVAFGLYPARAAFRTELTEALREGGNRSASPATARMRSALVICQVALALVLLAGAGLFTSSLLAMLEVGSGFETTERITFRVSVPGTRYPKAEDVLRFFSDFRRGLEALPQVERVAIFSGLPLSGQNVSSGFGIEGRPLAPGEQPPSVGWQIVTPGYFQTIGIPLLQGRDFMEADWDRKAHVTILNESAARGFFPGENPIGRRVTFGVQDATADWHEVIGVVGDVRHAGLDQPAGARAYDLLGQHLGRTLNVLAKTNGPPEAVLPSMRRVLRELDSEIPLMNPVTLEDLRWRSASDRRFLVNLVGSFSLLALALACIGIYGATTYAVTQRTHEIGIRMALGASPANVTGMVLQQGLGQVAAGAVLGIFAALLLTRAIQGLLFGVSASDPFSFLGAVLVLGIVALLACFLPARRAARTDPIVALRYE